MIIQKTILVANDLVSDFCSLIRPCEIHGPWHVSQDPGYCVIICPFLASS